MEKDTVAGEPAITEDEYHAQANKVKELVESMLSEKNGPSVRVIIEFAVGNVGERIDEMVGLNPLATMSHTKHEFAM